MKESFKMYNSKELCEIIERNAVLIGFPEEATDTFLCALNHITEREEEITLFSSLVDDYKNDINTDLLSSLDRVKGIGERLAIHEYTMNMLLFLAMADAMRDHYDEAKIDRRIFVNTLKDLKYQLYVCLDLYGVWGHSVGSWHFGFLRLTTFFFGRLQFQISSFNKEAVVSGYKLSPETKVLFVHIPRTGEKLNHERVLESYRAAAEFFAPQFKDVPMVFASNSWLLYPKNPEFLSLGSNLRAFYEDFNILSVEEYTDHKDVWRLFDKIYNGNPDDMPKDTSLRRAYVEMLKRGEKTGRALGAFIYGENVK